MQPGTTDETMNVSTTTNGLKPEHPMMLETYLQPATSPVPPFQLQNYLELVGSLVRQVDPARFQRERVILTERESGGQLLYHLLLAIQEEHGTSYTIPLTVIGDLSTVLDGIDQDKLQEGIRVVVKGRLTFKRVYDTRWATDEFPQGRSVQTVVVDVHTITPLTVLETRGEPIPPTGSFVSIEGKVDRPIRFGWHEIERATEIVRTAIQVPIRHVNSRGLEITTTDSVPVVLPIDLTGVEIGLRRGNTVQIGGFLEKVPIRLNPNGYRENELRAFLEDQEHWWGIREQSAVERETNRDGAPLSARARESIQTEAYRSVVRDKREVLNTYMLRVRAGKMALLEGEPITIEEARTEFDEWNKTQRKRRGRSRNAVRDDVLSGRDVRDVDDQVDEQIKADDEELENKLENKGDEGIEANQSDRDIVSPKARPRRKA